jgi:hypothetical protein
MERQDAAGTGISCARWGNLGNRFICRKENAGLAVGEIYHYWEFSDLQLAEWEECGVIAFID